MRKSQSADTRVVAAYDVLRALQLTNTDPMRASQVRGSRREVSGKRPRQLAGTPSVRNTAPYYSYALASFGRYALCSRI